MGADIFIEKLKSQGFTRVFEWHDEPGTEYPLHSHKGRVSFFVTAGCVNLYFKSGREMLICKGEKYEMLPGIEHRAKVGPQGCSWAVGEEIEGDA